MLVVLIMLVGYAGAESTDSIQDELINELSYPEYGPNSFDLLKDDSNVIKTMGKVPGLTENKEKLDWLNLIDAHIENSADELKPYMTESDGPIVGYGTNYGGYLFIEFDQDLKGKIDDTTIDNIYNSITKKAGIPEIPIVFRYGGEDIEESRSSYWRPIIGGIKITDTWYRDSTVSFAAVDDNGNEGYVISGHAALDMGGIGGTVFQSSLSAGTVTDIGGYYSDAAWVEYSNVDSQVYYTDSNILRDVYDETDPLLGATVYKSGEQTGLTSGTVTETYKKQRSSSFGYLYNQFKATYNSDSGDSGGPVLTTTSTGKIVLLGVHRGSITGDAVFSPISGVMNDLDIQPIHA